MSKNELVELKEYLEANCGLYGNNMDLMADAICFCDTYRAKCDLSTLSSNLRSDGKNEAAAIVRRYIS